MIDLNTIVNHIDPNTIGVIGIFLSVSLCANSAWTFLQERPRYFTVLALLALSWAILITFYSDNEPKNDIYPSLTRFLFVYIGGILSRADAHHQDANTGHISYSQKLSFWALLVIIGVIPFPSKAVFVVSMILTIICFFALWLGCDDLFGRGFYSVIVALVLVLYGCCDIYYEWLMDFYGQKLTTGWALTFAALKILVTVLLAYRLSIETMPPEDRLRPVKTFVFKQLPEGLRPYGY